jgi:hypothetical protein
MGKRERAKKQIKRLELRREVIRVLSSDNLSRVAGGAGTQCADTDNGCNLTRPSGP